MCRICLDQVLVDCAKEIHRELRLNEVLVELDLSNDPAKPKIADAEKMKVHTMLVIGSRDLEAGAVSIRVHGRGNLGSKPRAEAVEEILTAIDERRS